MFSLWIRIIFTLRRRCFLSLIIRVYNVFFSDLSVSILRPESYFDISSQLSPFEKCQNLHIFCPNIYVCMCMLGGGGDGGGGRGAVVWPQTLSFFSSLSFSSLFFFFLKGHNTCIAYRIFVYFSPLARKKWKKGVCSAIGNLKLD